MNEKKRLLGGTALAVLGVLLLLSPTQLQGAESAAARIAEAQAAIEQARQAGAEKAAQSDLAQARSWLAQAEREYDQSQSVLSKTMKLVVSDAAKTREILYLADMAGTRARIAEAKAKRAAAAAELKDARKDLADFQASMEVLHKKLAEAEQAKGVKAEAEAQLKALAQAKREVVALEEQKKRELEAAQKKQEELDALKRQEAEQARLLEARQAAESERLAALKAKEAVEFKAREEQRDAERRKMAEMQKRMAILEREKAMHADAARIPQATVRMAGGEMIVSVPVANLFTAKNELHNQGKTILDSVGGYLKKHAADRIMVRGFTDSSGREALNQSLSEQRARKVKEYLVLQQNIPAATVTVEGLGAAQPVASNANEAGRALNRRVEVSVPMGQ